jgi:flavin reductase (DIM6/NTAB) family NADH-FMN oxidoreductase RutF
MPTSKKPYRKKDFPVSNIRKFLEPGPIVLVSSHWKDQNNIMTMGWHTVMEFTPALIGCIISGANHSFEMIRRSKECVINIPTADMLETIVGIGTTTGAEINKFNKFKLTAQEANKVKAPLIKECYANFECKLIDTKLVSNYNFFILKVVKAHVAASPAYPTTVHYHGEGVFMISGKQVKVEGLNL